MDMLPQTEVGMEHENINELPVHPWTKQQIFFPAAESRLFTREDAARIFNPQLLSPENRIPHPELVEAHEALSDEDVFSPGKYAQKAADFRKAREEATAKTEAEEKARQEARTWISEGPKWNFKIEAVKSDAGGRNGRNPGGVGWRYGMPLEDRKRGHQKEVPSKVDQ